LDNNNVESNSDDDGLGEDFSNDAVQRRMEDLTSGAKGLMLNDDLEKTEQERVDIFYKYVKKLLPLEGSKYKEIIGEAERLEIKDKAPLVMCELLMSDGIVQELKQHRVLFLRLCHENKRAQKYLMGGIELVIKERKDTLLQRVPHILKSMYDDDIIDEEVILDWNKKISKKYVGKELAQEINEKAKPFIKWLQEAEEEESSSDEGASGDSEDENVEVVYSDRHISSGLQEVKESPTKPKTNGIATGTPTKAPLAPALEEHDDLDIDAI